jgi:hypothetical protein
MTMLNPTIEEELGEYESVKGFGELEKVDSHHLVAEDDGYGYKEIEVDIDDDTLVDDETIKSFDDGDSIADGAMGGDGLQRKRTIRVIIRSRAFL